MLSKDRVFFVLWHKYTVIQLYSLDLKFTSWHVGSA